MEEAEWRVDGLAIGRRTFQGERDRPERVVLFAAFSRLLWIRGRSSVWRNSAARRNRAAPEPEIRVNSSLEKLSLRALLRSQTPEQKDREGREDGAGGERKAKSYRSGERAEQVLWVVGVGVLVVVEKEQEGDRQRDQEDGDAGKERERGTFGPAVSLRVWAERELHSGEYSLA